MADEGIERTGAETVRHRALIGAAIVVNNPYALSETERVNQASALAELGRIVVAGTESNNTPDVGNPVVEPLLEAIGLLTHNDLIDLMIASVRLTDEEASTKLRGLAQTELHRRLDVATLYSDPELRSDIMNGKFHRDQSGRLITERESIEKATCLIAQKPKGEVIISDPNALFIIKKLLNRPHKWASVTDLLREGFAANIATSRRRGLLNHTGGTLRYQELITMGRGAGHKIICRLVDGVVFKAIIAKEPGLSAEDNDVGIKAAPRKVVSDTTPSSTPVRAGAKQRIEATAQSGQGLEVKTLPEKPSIEELQEEILRIQNIDEVNATTEAALERLKLQGRPLVAQRLVAERDGSVYIDDQILETGPLMTEVLNKLLRRYLTKPMTIKEFYDIDAPKGIPITPESLKLELDRLHKGLLKLLIRGNIAYNPAERSKITLKPTLFEERR